jgi:hypothetical protein
MAQNLKYNTQRGSGRANTSVTSAAGKRTRHHTTLDEADLDHRWDDSRMQTLVSELILRQVAHRFFHNSDHSAPFPICQLLKQQSVYL